ncbi:MAG: hypothetical protein ABSB35_31085, partial [Bryobacteraceae bacterium]
MNRNTGLVAGALVILTILGVSNLPNQSSQSTGAGETKESTGRSTKKASTSGPKESSPCKEIVQRLQRFVKDAAGPITPRDLPGFCFEPDPRRKQDLVNDKLGVQFAIATVPNPVSTHLPLMFDRIVETIQQAAQDDNYSYDSSWFPWDATGPTYPQFTDQQAAEEQQDIQELQPGVMVFRRALDTRHLYGNPYDDGLVIFLVGEQPTVGISDDQFQNALIWIHTFNGLRDGQPLRILGPTFSGSLPSLQR